MAEERCEGGQFVWRELMTPDPDAARTFYAALLGWGWQPFGSTRTGTYWIASAGERMVAGAMKTPPGAPMPPAWSSYLTVPDVDEAAAICRAAGGQVVFGPEDIPDVGRFATLLDRTGAAFQAFKPSTAGEPPPDGLPPPGTFCWETLVTSDPAAAKAFYAKLAGWKTAAGPGGSGEVFTCGEVPVADLQAARPGGPSYWATYVAVEDALASRDRAVELGGKVLVPRIDVPEVGTVAVIADPAGAALGLFQPGRG